MKETCSIARAIKKSGYKKGSIADALGISPQTLRLRLDNPLDFRVGEIKKLSKVLNLTNDEVISHFFQCR